MIRTVDTGDWDLAVGSNTPGQSGGPDSSFYDNLFEPWANDRFFPVFNICASGWIWWRPSARC